eukprot:5846993-Ditylum_brightwellii.AAC.1
MNPTVFANNSFADGVHDQDLTHKRTKMNDTNESQRMLSTWNVSIVSVNAAAAASAVALGCYTMQITPPKSANEQLKLLGDFSPIQSNDFSPEQGNDNL